MVVLDLGLELCSWLRLVLESNYGSVRFRVRVMLMVKVRVRVRVIIGLELGLL